MKKILILGFYGVGKTTYINDHPNAVDITDFKLDPVNCDPDALKKYWEDEEHDIVLADPQWTKVFLESGYPFYVVIPRMWRKDEFLNNFLKRWTSGSWKANIVKFYRHLDTYWEGWLEFYKNKIPCVQVIELDTGQWVGDAIDIINKL